MGNIERHAHWEKVYQTKGEREVSWFQESPVSPMIIGATGTKLRHRSLILAVAIGLVDAFWTRDLRLSPFLTFPKRHLQHQRQRLVREARKLSGSLPM